MSSTSSLSGKSPRRFHCVISPDPSELNPPQQTSWLVLKTDCALQLGYTSVFYKQRDNLYFPVSAYVLPTTVLRLPYSLFLATTWSVVVYWACGMAPSAGR